MTGEGGAEGGAVGRPTGAVRASRLWMSRSMGLLQRGHITARSLRKSFGDRARRVLHQGQLNSMSPDAVACWSAAPARTGSSIFRPSPSNVHLVFLVVLVGGPVDLPAVLEGLGRRLFGGGTSPVGRPYPLFLLVAISPLF